jgi:hypothetical protein
MKAYNELNKELIVQIGNGEITAQNGLVKLLRLAQITGGYLALDDKSNEIIDSTKLNMAVDFLIDLPEEKPVVVFFRFENEIRRLAEEVRKKFPKRTVGFICGFLDSPIDFYDGVWHATHTNTLFVQVD